MVCVFLAVPRLTACAPTPTPTPITLRLAATDLAAPLLFDLVAAYAEANPRVDLIPTVVPLSTLEADLAAGGADLGLLVSRDPAWFATPIGYVTFAVVVNPSNPVTGLSAAQVRAIYAGQISDWGQVGGEGGVIQPVGREEGAEAEKAFSSAMLPGARFTISNNTLVAPTWEAMREAVSQDINAIGYLPAPELDATVRPLSLDAEWRALVVAAAVNEPAGPARDFLAWAQSEAGQAVVGERYERVK